MATQQNSCLWTPLTPSMPLDSPLQDQIDQLPITPPDSAQPFNEKPRKVDESIIRHALHVLSNERAALSHIENIYASSIQAQSYFTTAVSLIVRCQQEHGKVVFTGVGKSRLIAEKLVATFNSLAIQSVFLHPIEALHGDLGMIRPKDVVLMITYSGKTAELLSLLPHLPSHLPLIAITSHLDPSSCAVLSPGHRKARLDDGRKTPSVLLPAPIHTSEKETFGLSAPTMSTTVAMALGDALALTVAQCLHSTPGHGPAEIFARYHPGGAIGACFSSMTDLQSAAKMTRSEPRMQNLATRVDDVPLIQMHHSKSQPTNFDILSTAVRSPGGWVRTNQQHIIGPRRIQRLINRNDRQQRTPSDDTGLIIKTSTDLSLSQEEMEAEDERQEEEDDDDGCLAVEKSDWISIPGSSTVHECRDWIINMREQGDGRGKLFLKRGTILGIVDEMNGVSGVVEIEDVVGDDFPF